MVKNDCPYHELHARKIEEYETRLDEHDSKINSLEISNALAQEQIGKYTEKINSHEVKITKLDKVLAVALEGINKSMERLAELPEAVGSMEKTMISMQNTINNSTEKTNNLEKKINTVEAKINSIDGDGQINIRKFLKDNWISLIIGITVLVALGATYLPILISQLTGI